MKSHRQAAQRMKNCRGFSMVELLVVIAIIGLLVGLAIPQFQHFLDRAHSAACAGNLRAIGIAVRNYLNEHDSTFPVIETNPDDPVYPEEVEARGMLETLEPYGLSAGALRCKADAADRNYFATRGTSYEWRPIVDGEPSMNPTILTRRGERRVNPARVRLCMDFEPVHRGRMNLLYADGRVRSF